MAPKNKKKNSKQLVHSGPAVTEAVKEFEAKGAQQIAEKFEVLNPKTETVETKIETVKAKESEIASMLLPKGVDAIMDVQDLRVDFKVNPRHENNYDVDHMVKLIYAAGRILDPIYIRKSDKMVFRGNRRTLAAVRILSKPETCSAELREALTHVKVVVFDGLEPDEELALIYDHGSTKPLVRSEIIQGVWQLEKLFFSETQIIDQLYYSLAQFTKRQDKVVEIQNLEGAEKTKALRKWLHGTVGNWFLAVNKLGPYIRDQFILQYRSQEKLLGEDEKVELQTILAREVVAELQKRKKQDESDEGKGWTPETGGLKFNEYVEELKLGKGKPKRKQPSPRDLKDRADLFLDYGIRAALKYASGEPEGGMDAAKVRLNELDETGYRLRKINNTLSECIGNVTDEKVVELLHAIVKGTPDDVVAALEPYCVK